MSITKFSTAAILLCSFAVSVPLASFAASAQDNETITIHVLNITGQPINCDHFHSQGTGTYVADAGKEPIQPGISTDIKVSNHTDITGNYPTKGYIDCNNSRGAIAKIEFYYSHSDNGPAIAEDCHMVKGDGKPCLFDQYTNTSSNSLISVYPSGTFQQIQPDSNGDLNISAQIGR